MSYPKFLQPHLEWEVLNDPISIDRINDDKYLPVGEKRILIDRDEDYKLRAVLMHKDAMFELPQEVFNIQGSSDPDISYTLESAFITNNTSSGILGSGNITSKASIYFQGLKMKTGNPKEGKRLVEWYINGPRNRVFSRITDRKAITNFSRDRFESKDIVIQSLKNTGEASGFSVDFMKIRTDDLQFMIGKVPQEFGPQWSSNIAIEYAKNGIGLPDNNQREKVTELCSFVLGRQLLEVGYSLYDDSSFLVETYSRSPWGNLAKPLCTESDYPPIAIDNLPPTGKAEAIIQKLLPKYLELRDVICLKEGLLNYWISRQMPLGTNLPILASGVESIIHGWFRQSKSKSKGVYISNEEFSKLLADVIGQIDIKLVGQPDKEKIIGKIKRANEFGMLDNYRKFFAELDLKVEKEEYDALTGRHIFVHGGATLDQTDWNKVASVTNAFETLFNKIMLKLLGYSGNYISRSLTPWNPNSNLT